MDEDQRWGIWIDVEGFSKLWEAGPLALRGLNQLTDLVYRIGRNCFPNEPDRIFAHQIGDGFYIASDFHEPCLDRCVAIAIVLLRAMTEIGCVARASIAEGSISDYSGCRPRHIQAQISRSGDRDVLSLGAGVMTLQAVMGLGIIAAVTLDKATQTKGALLSISADRATRLSSTFIARPLVGAPDVVVIDWVHSSSPVVDDIVRKIGIPTVSDAVLRARLTDYVTKHGLNDAWRDPTFYSVGIV